MKARVTFKTPDVFEQIMGEFSDDEQEEFLAVAKIFIEYSECVTLEIDTVAGTCVVVPL